MPDDENISTLEDEDEIELAEYEHIEVLSDDEDNEILRVTASGAVIEDEDEESEDDAEDAPAEPEVSAEPAVEPEAEPPVPVQAGPAESDADGPVEVPKFSGFSVTPDGLGVYEPAYENANSQEAEALIFGEIDEDTGEVISEGIGEREYARRCGAYEVAKYQYGLQKQTEIRASIEAGVGQMKREIENLYPSLATKYNVTPEDAQEFAPVLERAFKLIDTDREERARLYISAGYEPETAVTLASRDVLTHPGIFKIAFDSAKVQMEDEVDAIKERLREKAKGKPATKEPAKVEPIAERLTPPQTTTATSVAVKDQGSALPVKVDLRGIPKEALIIARQTGIDPRKLI